MIKKVLRHFQATVPGLFRAGRGVAAAVGIGVMIVYAWLLILVVHTSGQQAELPDRGVVLILGHASPGGIPSDWLMERLVTGATLYHQLDPGLIVVSGGTGPTDAVSVASIMYNTLVEMGIPSESILIEDNAANTVENFTYSLALLERAGDDGWLRPSLTPIIHQPMFVVTNGFHVYRSLLFGRHHIPHVQPASAEAVLNPELVLAYLREPLSIVFNFVRYNILG